MLLVLVTGEAFSRVEKLMESGSFLMIAEGQHLCCILQR